MMTDQLTKLTNQHTNRPTDQPTDQQSDMRGHTEVKIFNKDVVAHVKKYNI